VEFHSGAILETQNLVTYNALGTTQGVSLVYDSLRADPRPIIHVTYPNVVPSVYSVPSALRLEAKLSVSRGTFTYQQPGNAGGQLNLTGGENFWTIPTTAGPVTAALQVDLRTQPSGLYDYTLTSGIVGYSRSVNGYIGSTTPMNGHFLLINSVNSPFGAGWGLAGLQQLVQNPDGSILLIDGNGTEELYGAPATPGGPFVSPPGDYSTLQRQSDGSYLLTDMDQTISTFNSQLLLTQVRDRNGNTTIYSYDATGLLTAITDPVGLVTSFAYTNGKVTSITDPAGRTTQLTYDSSGNLIQVTNPNGSQQKWEYDTGHHQTAAIDPLGHRGQDAYDSFGRATQATLADGSTTKVGPVETRGLYPPIATIDPVPPTSDPSKPLPPMAVASSTAMATYTDGNGNVTQTVLDSGGQPVSGSDGVGSLSTFQYDANHKVTQTTDPLGNVTSNIYDNHGNVTSITDLAGDTTLRSHLLAFYPFEGNANDASGNGNNAVVNGATLTTGIEGMAYHFNGTSDYIQAPVNINPSVHPQLTMGAWVKADDATPVRQVISHDSGGYDRTLGLDYRGGGTGWSAFAGDAGVLGFQPVTVGQWVFLAVVYDQAAKSVTLYVNNNVFHTSGTLGAGFNYIRIGSNPGFGEFFSGTIDDVFLYDTALTANQIASIRAGGSATILSSGGKGQVRSYTYDPTYNELASTTDELGHQTLYDIDPANGNVRSETRVVGGGSPNVVTQYTYTPQGLLQTETDPLGHVTRYDYDALGRLTTLTTAMGTPDQGVQHFEHNAAGNLTASVDENGNRTEYTYDPMNRLVKVHDALGHDTAYAYDQAGNLMRQTDARGNMTRYEYDALNRQTMTIDALNGQTVFAYDSAGNLSSVTDPLGHQTKYKYDARNRPTDRIDPSNGDTQFGYDLNNNLTLIVDPDGNQTHFTYDGRNRLVKEVDPLGNSTSYVYDGADNLVSRTDGDGRTVQFTYDALDQLTAETWVGSSEVIHYGYDADGNLTSASDSFSGLTFTYNARGTVKTADNAGTPNAPHVVLTYGYDPVGNVTSLADTINGKAAGTNTNQVNALNEVTRITQSGTNVQSKRVDLTYNEVGQLASIQRFADLTGNQSVVQSTYSYDALNRLTGLTHSKGTTMVAFESLQYDAASRITQITNADGTSTYTYDTTDQLEAVQNSNPALPSESYSYDANGNRTASSQPGSNYQTGAGNQVQTDGKFNYKYDADGNLISRSEIATGKVRTFQWDYRNRVVTVIDKDGTGNLVQRVDYTYDALDRRISESVQQGSGAAALAEFVYEGDSVLLDFAGAAGSSPAVLKERYLNGPAVDQVFAQDDGTGKVQWLLADHEGSVRDLVDNSGTVVNHIMYDSFGNVLKQTNPTMTTRYLFAGREFDAATGLYDDRSRYYDPGLGKFLNEDLSEFGGADVNLYRYVLNNPLALVDPFGYQSSPASSSPSSAPTELIGNCHGGAPALYDLATGARQPIKEGYGSCGLSATRDPNLKGQNDIEARGLKPKEIEFTKDALLKEKNPYLLSVPGHTVLVDPVTGNIEEVYQGTNGQGMKFAIPREQLEKQQPISFKGKRPPYQPTVHRFEETVDNFLERFPNVTKGKAFCK
jgi:RHS repeat-associated protein